MRKSHFFALSAALLLAACASPAPDPTATPEAVLEPLEVTVIMTEYAYNPKVIEASVGQEVILHLVNEGALDHSLVIGREVVREGGIPDDYTADMFESAGVEPVLTPEIEMGMEHESMEHTGTYILVPVTDREVTVTFT
ncbi:MAG: lipoprotein, partial [Anaerolineales bacterium]